MDIKMIIAAILIPVICGFAAILIISKLQTRPARRRDRIDPVSREDSDL